MPYRLPTPPLPAPLRAQGGRKATPRPLTQPKMSASHIILLLEVCARFMASKHLQPPLAPAEGEGGNSSPFGYGLQWAFEDC